MNIMHWRDGKEKGRQFVEKKIDLNFEINKLFHNFLINKKKDKIVINIYNLCFV